jgi:hypothetical protein
VSRDGAGSANRDGDLIFCLIQGLVRCDLNQPVGVAPKHLVIRNGSSGLVVNVEDELIAMVAAGVVAFGQQL